MNDRDHDYRAASDAARHAFYGPGGDSQAGTVPPQPQETDGQGDSGADAPEAALHVVQPQPARKLYVPQQDPNAGVLRKAGDPRGHGGRLPLLSSDVRRVLTAEEVRVIDHNAEYGRPVSRVEVRQLAATTRALRNRLDLALRSKP